MYLGSLVHENLIFRKNWRCLAFDFFWFLLPLYFGIILSIFTEIYFSFALLWVNYFFHEHLAGAYFNYSAILFWIPSHQTYAWQFTLLGHELASSSWVIFKLFLSLFLIYGLFETFVQTHVAFLSPSASFRISHLGFHAKLCW